MFDIILLIAGALYAAYRIAFGNKKSKSVLFKKDDGSLKLIPKVFLGLSPSSHNRQLANAIEKANMMTHNAKTPDELDSAIDVLRQISDGTKFKNLLTIPSAMLGLFLAVFSLLFADERFIKSFMPGIYEMLNGTPPIALSAWFGIIGVPMMIVSVVMLTSRYGIINGLNRNIYMKDVLIDNQFSEVNIESPKDHLKPFSRDFIEFSRGNHDQKITEHYTRRSDDLNFDMYRFDYAIKRTTGSGKNRRTTIDRYVRFGIIFELECPDFLFVNKSDNGFDTSKIDIVFKEKINTSSIVLNEKFKTYARSALEFTKFAKPSVIEQIMKKVTKFDKLNIETHKNKVLISFADDDVIHPNRNTSITDIEAFQNEINQHRVLRKLDDLISIIEKMKKFNDKNF